MCNLTYDIFALLILYKMYGRKTDIATTKRGLVPVIWTFVDVGSLVFHIVDRIHIWLEAGSVNAAGIINLPAAGCSSLPHQRHLLGLNSVKSLGEGACKASKV